MASIGHSTKVGLGAITARSVASGAASVVLYDYVATWVHGATGQASGTSVKPKRPIADDSFIQNACNEGDMCMIRLKPGSTSPTLYVLDEDYGFSDCP